MNRPVPYPLGLSENEGRANAKLPARYSASFRTSIGQSHRTGCQVCSQHRGTHRLRNPKPKPARDTRADAILLAPVRVYGGRRRHPAAIGSVRRLSAARNPQEHGQTLAGKAQHYIVPSSSRPIKCSVFLPISMPMVLATTASVFCDMQLYDHRRDYAHASRSGKNSGNARPIPVRKGRSCAWPAPQYWRPSLRIEHQVLCSAAAVRRDQFSTNIVGVRQSSWSRCPDYSTACKCCNRTITLTTQPQKG